MVRIMLGDFRNGYPAGKYPLADVTFTALREGTTPLTVSVDHVRYLEQRLHQVHGHLVLGLDPERQFLHRPAGGGGSDPRAGDR